MLSSVFTPSSTLLLTILLAGGVSAANIMSKPPTGPAPNFPLGIIYSRKACPADMEGQLMCSDNTFELENMVVRCVKGYLDFANGTPCKAGTKCRVLKSTDPFLGRLTQNNAICDIPCQEGTRRCAPANNAAVQTCTNGFWQTNDNGGAVCPNSGVCDPNTPSFCRECKEGAVECQYNPFDGSQFSATCVNGAFVPKEICSTNQYCNQDSRKCTWNQGFECENGQTRCYLRSSDRRELSQECKAGKWTTLQVCTRGCNEKSTKCYS